MSEFSTRVAGRLKSLLREMSREIHIPDVVFQVVTVTRGFKKEIRRYPGRFTRIWPVCRFDSWRLRTPPPSRLGSGTPTRKTQRNSDSLLSELGSATQAHKHGDPGSESSQLGGSAGWCGLTLQPTTMSTGKRDEVSLESRSCGAR